MQEMEKTKMKEKKDFFYEIQNIVFLFFWFKRGLDQGPEQRESKLTVLCLLIIIILISYIIIIYYFIINYREPSQPKQEIELTKHCFEFGRNLSIFVYKLECLSLPRIKNKK